MLGEAGQGPEPYVLLLDRGARTDARGLQARGDPADRQGWLLALYSPRVRAITLIYRGLLGDGSRESASALLAGLQEALARGEADVVRLRSLRVGSPLHELASTAPSFLGWQHVATRTAHWQLALPGSYDEFLRSLSSRTREGVRRYSRKLEREHGERLELRRFAAEAELEEFFADAHTIAERTYQHGLGVAVTDDAAHRRLIEAAARRGWFRAWVLSIDGRPAAFWHGFAHGGAFAIGVPGDHPEYGHLRVGTYVLMKAIEELCEDDEVETIDFGFGDAEYKRRFGTERWEEEDVLVYAPTLRGARVNLTRTAVLRAAGLARRVAEGAPALQGLKRRWRSRLSS